MKSFLVIGEECTDVFIYGKAERLSPEAPVPVFVPINSVRNRGMAGNVIENLHALMNPNNIGVIFDCTSYSEAYIKKRYVDEKSNHIFLRVDIGEEHIIPLKVHEEVIKMITTSDCLIISDYNKGYLSNDAINDIFLYSPESQIKIVDTKRILSQQILENADFIKLNTQEYENNYKVWGDVLNSYNEKIIVTKGGEGAYYNKKMYPVERKQTIDVSGAGDTFVAAFAFKYAKTFDAAVSIIYANEMASFVVNKRGVTTI